MKGKKREYFWNIPKDLFFAHPKNILKLFFFFRIFKNNMPIVRRLVRH
jgi:hypothetical protein